MGTRIITLASSQISRILATTRSLSAIEVCTARLTSAILGNLSDDTRGLALADATTGLHDDVLDLHIGDPAR